MFFSKQIPANDKHLIQHRWKNLYKIEDNYKKLYEAHHLYTYALEKRGSTPRFKNQEKLSGAINLVSKIQNDSNFLLTPEMSTAAINHFQDALIQLKVLAKRKTKS